jgi:Na+/proline symporter
LYAASHELSHGWTDVAAVWGSPDSRVFVAGDAQTNALEFLQAIVSGALITIAMTGLDQDRMQKNLACRTLKQSQLNMTLFSLLLILVNMVFLWLGAVLYLLARQKGIELPPQPDLIYPTIAFEHLASGAGLVFLLGILAATFSGADSALTAMTTSTCVGFLGFTGESDDPVHRRIRGFVHLGFAGLTFVVILLLHQWSPEQSAIMRLLSLVGIVYGPLLGLFAFGLCTRRQLREPFVPWICILAPLVTFYLEQQRFFCNVQLGTLIILACAMVTLLGLAMISRKATAPPVHWHLNIFHKHRV